ncbi:hypothetical protein BCR33DRAFT_852469 [Rhizoclosmatium globosum]|uniref:Uncharacterized protein n=1 Tax=Rhizoclosmatium globosum TaxID=329046 RepID=A0A1Y2C1V2_9FUNG|nr:hypothetical protein BCR33DRAFT_852469 [Rhizoclosmatium globosum]|eukprot:ORY41010.1 hypothetical protein BCR33DRAFT_852469 [Rhizoclosmatium globosum]
MPLWKRNAPKAKPISTSPTNLARIDDATLLSLEQAARKNHKKAIAKAVGSSSKFIYKSPVAAVSIARSGLAAKGTYFEHAEVLKEVQRRGLVPLAQAPDENIYVMIAGQLVAVAVGHKVGAHVAETVIEPVFTYFGGIAVEKMTEKLTEAVVENATENTFADILARANVKVPGFNAPKKNRGASATSATSNADNADFSDSPQAPVSLPPRQPLSQTVGQSSSQSTSQVANQATSPAVQSSNSQWQQPDWVDNSSYSAPPPSYVYDPQQQPIQSRPTSSSSSKPLSRTQTLLKGAVTAVSTVKGIATNVLTKKTTSERSLDASGLYISNPSSSSSSSSTTTTPTNTAHFSGLWTGIGEETEIVVVDEIDPDEDIQLEKLKQKLHISQFEKDDRGGQQGVCVVARYPMKFDFKFNGFAFEGVNVVDSLDVNGVVTEDGHHVDFGETCVDADGKEVQVFYRGRIGGGQLIGEWVSSDGRQGLFRVRHV